MPAFAESAFSRSLSLAVSGLAIVLSVACADSVTTGPRAHAVVSVAALTPEVVRMLSLEVTGPGIDVPLIANFPVDTTATPPRAGGTVRVPTGSARRLRLEARDVGGTVTHRADTTLTLGPGEHAVVLQMRAVETTLGITVTFPMD
jgi:hypothetical protein